jgi:D-alanine-D-alanine ligase
MREEKVDLILIFGGVSIEHEQSVQMAFHFISEAHLYGHLFKNIYIFYFDQNRRVFLFESISASIIKDAFVDVTKAKQLSRSAFCERISKPNVFVYSLLQGQEGEDGVIQGTLEFLDVPSNTGAIGPSHLSMNKFVFSMLCKTFMPSLGSAASLLVSRSKCIGEVDDFLKRSINGRVIVRPNSQGASAYTEVFNKSDLSAIYSHCVEIAAFGDQALIQEFILGTEVTCGCLQIDGVWIATHCYVVRSPRGFMGQAEKKGLVPYAITKLNDIMLEVRIQELCLTLAEKFDFHTQCRFDLIWDGEHVHVLECNSKPGLLTSSIYPRMLSELGFRAIDLAKISFNNECRRRKESVTCSSNVS